MRAITFGVVALLGAGGPGCGGTERRDEERSELAKLAADKLVEHAQRWQLSSGKDCPDGLLDVARFAGLDQPDTIDPWGTPYELFCGANNLPPGARGPFAVLSYGPDKKKGTADDLASWRPRP